MDVEVLIFSERDIMRDTINKNTEYFHLKVTYLFHSVSGFVFVFLTSASVSTAHRY